MYVRYGFGGKQQYMHRSCEANKLGLQGHFSALSEAQAGTVEGVAHIGGTANRVPRMMVV